MKQFNFKTVVGIGSVTLPKTLKASFKSLRLHGNSTQGYMIKVLPTELEQGTLNASNGENFPSNYRVRTKDFISVEKGLYKITCEGAKQGNLIEYEENGTYKKTQFIAHTLLPWVVEFTEKCKVRITVSNGTEAEQILIKPSDVKSITLQAEATSETPQEIVSAGKYDEVSGKYVIDVSVTGKNLIDVDELRNENGYLKSSFTSSTKIKPFKVESGKKYLLVAKGKPLKTGIYSSMYLGEDDLKYMNINTYVFTTGTGIVMFSENKEFKKILIARKTTTVTRVIIHGQNEIKDAYDVEELGLFEMLDDDWQSVIYEPYKEPQTVKIQLDEPLRGIGEYKDVVTKDGILRKIKEIVLDENTGFETYWATLNKTFAFISPAIKDATVINGTPNRLLCNYFKVLPAGFDRTDEEVCLLFNRRFHVRFLKERNIDTVEKLKEWLKQNPIKIQYLLQEPVLEPFENSLDSLHTNDGTTIITVDAGEAKMKIEATYKSKRR